jgi:mannose-6-phosphate isomerase-like protein (cupin superfamily)
MFHRGRAQPALIRPVLRATPREEYVPQTMMKRTLLKEGSTFTGRSGATLEIEALPTQGHGGRLNGRIELLRTFPPGEGRSRRHRHMDFDETYEILDGVADAWINGLSRRLTSESGLFRIPSGTDHVNPFSNDNTGLRLRHTIAPATEAALAYVNTLGQLMNEGRDDDGELPPLATLAVFERMQGRTYLSQLPVWSQQRLLGPIGARLAQRRGYSVAPARLAKRSDKGRSPA